MKQHRNTCGVALLTLVALGLFGFGGNASAQRSAGKAGAGGNMKVLVSYNGPDNAGEVGQFGLPLNTKMNKVQIGNNEGIALDSQGDLFQCGDGKPGPSIRVFSRFSQRAIKKGVEFDPKRDREIKGAKTTLKNPKGLDIASTPGLLFVAENGNGTILIFSSEAAGDVEPIDTLTPPAKPWDLEYDDASDTLYVALVNGKVAVYEKFVFSGFNSTPARVIEPEGAVNLHGIVYDKAKDMLLLSDVGDAKSNEDGKLFVIKLASKANGPVKPARTIEGAATKLGNPVDIVWDGKDLYVAEKANDLLLVFKNFAVGPSGAINADVVVNDIKPEALLLLNE